MSMTIIVPLSIEEQQALNELARIQELSPERVMIQALRLYQLTVVGDAKVVMPPGEKAHEGGNDSLHRRLSFP